MNVDQFLAVSEAGDDADAPALVPAFEPLRLGIGIWPDVPEAAYHADCAYDLSASASALRALITESPAHCAYDHPRLNRQWRPSGATDEQIKGTILHSLMLDTPPPFRVLDFKDYKKKDAQAAKIQCYKDGKLPVLASKMDALVLAAEAIRNVLIDTMPEVWAALTDPDTLNEATLIYQYRGALIRSRCDILPPDRYLATYDFKFTGRSAEPEAWQKKLVNDYLIQSVLYPRGVEILRGDKPEFRYLVCEWDPPYGVSMHALHPSLEAIGETRLADAIDIWNECVATGKWPSYPAFVHYAEPPGWLSFQEEERTIRREAGREWTKRQAAKLERAREMAQIADGRDDVPPTEEAL